MLSNGARNKVITETDHYEVHNEQMFQFLEQS